jgi:type II secretory pathway predicted ATPase ExeA
LNPTEFLQYTVADFGLSASGMNKCELLTELSKFLIARGAKKMTTVLIVDEAHQLSSETLEEIRLLSNLETPTEKLLQIMLVGQPELDEKLDTAGLRQLKQRIALRTQLRPLSAEETKTYIERRLRIAGADSASTPLFPPHTLVKVHRYSLGLPRLINTICENALITAYAKRLPSVTPEIIEEVARDFRLDLPNSNGSAATKVRNKLEPEQISTNGLDLYTSFRTPIVSGVGLDAPITAEETKYEPDI